MNYVIIGNSTAAVGTVEGIRQLDRDGAITVISNEPHHVYSRPLISYYLEKKTDLDRMKYRPDSFYQDNHVTLLSGREAKKLDTEKKEVVLDGDERIPYDRLMIATGSRPFTIPFEGRDTVPEQYTFMTLNDALALEKSLQEKKNQAKVLIIGAGLIGLKCAEGIRRLCKEITVIDLAPRILSSVLDEEAAAMVQQHMEGEGVRFILGHSAKSFAKDTALLDNGEKLNFDILVIAMGVRPNVELVAEAGGTVNRGILVDENQKTSLPDVYAAGDCVVSHDISAETDRILAILPNAYRQGEAGGLSMAGKPSSFATAIPMNAGGFFGLHIITAGTYAGEVYRVREGGSLKELFYEKNLLKGFIMVGDVSRAGIYTSLIQNRTPLDQIDFSLVAENPCLMAFSQKYRDEKLGGVTL